MSGETVTTYATVGLRLWWDRVKGHGDDCGCLCCADFRAYFGMAARVPQIAPTPARRQDRAS